MIVDLFKKIFGTRNERILRQFTAEVSKINALEPAMQALSDTQLQAKTAEFKQRIVDGAKLDDLLVEAFAVAREAAVRVMGMRHYDVQLIGGMILHSGKVAEMRTGEGKTLVATLPIYLNALAGKGVHLVTVNDYLAERDANWMRPLYKFLGMEVGINISNMAHDAKQVAYNADITYGTNNEFGFDYLRDNMAFEANQRVQRPLFFSIVDEVDSILIDESRTPLIISGQIEEMSELYQKIDPLIPKLKRQMKEETFEMGAAELSEDERGDYVVDEKNKHAFLTEAGHQHIEKLLVAAGLIDADKSLYDVSNIHLMHYINAALRAHTLFHLDVDYIVKDDEVIIVDEHTGRLMNGRRWSEGLHQAVEAKEKVAVQVENQTLATITFQNYFRLYEKLAGMTGTADTEAFELQSIYGLEVVVVPTHKPMVRDDQSDQVFLTSNGKYKAIIADIKTCVERGQPVLVGTASIESSELVSKLLKQENIFHQVLNAKAHEREAGIIAQAGMPGAVTIATNMAGRGTDIVLGGNVEDQLELAETAEERARIKAKWQEAHDAVLAAGGLRVIGTERHESRRIDNQLRGRSGRQGDVGSTRFYLSLDDNLMRIFMAERMAGMMRKMGVGEDDVIESGLVSKAIENAQRKVEGMNFDVRKNLLEFDDVANDQRKVIYTQRAEFMDNNDVSAAIKNIIVQAINNLVDTYMPPETLEEQWDVPGLLQQLKQDFALTPTIETWLEQDSNCDQEEMKVRLLAEINKVIADKEELVGVEIMRQIERSILLQCLDNHWKEHLAFMDQLRKGIHLRAYAQKDPKQEFKRESFDLFQQMLVEIKYEVASSLALIAVHPEQEAPAIVAPVMELNYHHDDLNINDATISDAEVVDMQQPFSRDGDKVGRNDPCPCGSGNKYKQCHGKL
jgi:preprotein translocase subunit SecA